MLWVGNHDSRDTKGMALSCRWFGVLVRKAGDLEPPRVGPRGRIFASFWSTECRTASGVRVRHSTQVSDALMPRIGPTPCGSSPPAFRTDTPNQRRLKAMPLVSRESRSPTHGTQTGFQTPLMAIKHMIIAARSGGLGPEPPQGPRGVAPCPGFSAAHCWGALKPSLSQFSRFSQIRHL